MKRCIVLSLCLFLLIGLFACSAKILPKNDDDLSLLSYSLYQPQNRGKGFIETENALYYLCNNSKIYYSDKESLAYYILCGKPNCPHSGVDCNASCDYTLCYWNGHLYGSMLLGVGDPYIFRINLDGTERKEITEVIMPMNADGSSGGAYFFYSNGQYLYYYVQATPCYFFQVDLSTGTTQQLFDTYFQKGAEVCSEPVFDGDKMYFALKHEDGNCVLYLYQSQKDELTPLCDWTEFVDEAYAVADDTIYFYARTRKAFCEYNWRTGEMQESDPQSYYGGAAYYDKDNVYLVKWDDAAYSNLGLEIFDRDYHLLEKVNIPTGSDYDFASAEYLFFGTDGGNHIKYYLPKSAIGTGEAELLPIEDPYSYR